MKRFFLFPVFFALILSGCTSEEPIPFDYIEGEFQGARVAVNFNGMAVEEPMMLVGLKKEDGVSAINSNNAETKFAFDRLFCVITEDNPDFRNSWRELCDSHFDFLRMDGEATSYSDKILLKGERTYYSEGKDIVRFTMDGVYTKAPVGKTPLIVNVNSEVYKEGLTSRTFEMDFTDDAFDVSYEVLVNKILPRTKKRTGEAFEEFCQSLRENFLKRSSFDKIRFTFNGDGSITVLVHDVASDSYIAQETRSRYTPAENNRIFFVQDKAWTEYFFNKFSPFSYDCWTTLPMGFYDTTLEESALAMMSSFISFENGCLNIMPRSGIKTDLMQNHSWTFIISWSIMISDKIKPGEDLHRDLVKAIGDGWLKCEVKFIAHPV